MQPGQCHDFQHASNEYVRCRTDYFHCAVSNTSSNRCGANGMAGLGCSRAGTAGAVGVARGVNGGRSVRHDMRARPLTKRRNIMLYTIAVVLTILWLLGIVSAYTMGGFIHVLLVIAIVMILLRVISGNKPV